MANVRLWVKGNVTKAEQECTARGILHVHPVHDLESVCWAILDVELPCIRPVVEWYQETENRGPFPPGSLLLWRYLN